MKNNITESEMLSFLKEMAIKHLTTQHNYQETALINQTPSELFSLVCETTKVVREQYLSAVFGHEDDIVRLPYACGVFICAKQLGWMTSDFQTISPEFVRNGPKILA